jgi:nicotinamidase-related amidase
MPTGPAQFTDSFTELHPDALALLTVDAQNDFAGPTAGYHISDTAAVVARLLELVRAARAAGRPIYHIVRIYLADGSNAELSRRAAPRSGHRGLLPGSDGAELVAGLAPPTADRLDSDRLLRGEPQQLGEREWALYKPRWGAFTNTPLADLLRVQGIDSVLISGFSFPRCVLGTIFGASERDFRVGLVTDATSEVSEPEVGQMRGIGVQMMTTAQAQALFKEAHSRPR